MGINKMKQKLNEIYCIFQPNIATLQKGPVQSGKQAHTIEFVLGENRHVPPLTHGFEKVVGQFVKPLLFVVVALVVVVVGNVVGAGVIDN